MIVITCVRTLQIALAASYEREATSQMLATRGMCLACELLKAVSWEVTQQFSFVFLIRGGLMLVKKAVG